MFKPLFWSQLNISWLVQIIWQEPGRIHHKERVPVDDDFCCDQPRNHWLRLQEVQFGKFEFFIGRFDLDENGKLDVGEFAAMIQRHRWENLKPFERAFLGTWQIAFFYCIFSVMRRYRTNVSYSVREWVTLRTDLTDVTLVSEDTYCRRYWWDSGDWWYSWRWC